MVQTNRELVYEATKEWGCSSAKSISAYIKRSRGIDISPSSVSGTLRALVDCGKVGKSSLTGETVYWVNKNV